MIALQTLYEYDTAGVFGSGVLRRRGGIAIYLAGEYAELVQRKFATILPISTRIYRAQREDSPLQQMAKLIKYSTQSRILFDGHGTSQGCH